MARSTGSKNTMFLLCISFSFASSFRIRLRGGYSNIMGRVEVNLDDGYGWGTVCDDSWDSDDAEVACRSLGLPVGHATPVGEARFGEGTGYIHMDDVACSGSEYSLRHCSFRGRTSEDCSHSEDAGVICWISSFSHTYHPFISNSDPRVINPLDGMLMLNYTYEKYAVGICSNNFTYAEARVACSELGHRRYSTHVLSKDTYGKSDVLLHLSFTCSGSESRLSSCQNKLLYGICPHNPFIVCNYRSVSSINLFGNQVSQQTISLDINLSYKLNCETELARPQPIVTWVLDNKIVDFGVKNSTIVSGSLYRVKSTLTINANNSFNGKSIICCSRDPFGYQICSLTHTLKINVYPTVNTMEMFHTKRNVENETGDILTCISQRSRPEPIIHWYQNGMKISDPEMIATESLNSADGTFRTTSILTFPFQEIRIGSTLIECKVSVGKYHNMISVPYFIRNNVYPTIKTMEMFHTKRNVKNETGDIFTCISQRSRPEPTIHWYHNGIQIFDPGMISTECQNLADGTLKTTSTLTFPFQERMSGSNIIECKVSVEKYVNMISIPYFIRDDDSTAGKLESPSGGDSDDISITGYVISYICFGGVIVILSVVVLCLSRKIRKLGLNNSGNANVAATSSSGGNMARENRAYNGSDSSYPLENYEQLAPPRKKRGLDKREDTVYENVRI